MPAQAGMTIYMSDILQTIVEKRRADIERLGLNFGIDIPEKRRVGHTEFLGNAGAILEVKRASPSKGDIAPDLNLVTLATTYAEAHAQAVSVLTEMNYFKGSLRDLIAVADLMESRRQQGLHACAVLRKDFLLFEDEIDILFLLRVWATSVTNSVPAAIPFASLRRWMN